MQAFLKKIQAKISNKQNLLTNRKMHKKIIYVRDIQVLTREELESICRDRCYTAYIGKETLLCRVLGRYKFYCDAEDIGITPHLCLDGYWESWITMAMARILKKGWHCIDIGANHGYYSVLMADAVGSSGRVLAVEPNPKLVGLLERTLEVNGFQNHAKVLQKAISNIDNQLVQLVIPMGKGLNATICTDATLADKVVEVNTITLDNLTQDWSSVDFIKIDAEGAEQSIWYGMSETLRKNKNITIVMEFNCGRYSDPKMFLQDIESFGFQLQHIDYDSQIKNLTIEQCLTERPNEDWMLLLQCK
ncbi:MAG: FkbM family methyltransferase [Mojavia pulchra JT2-VF2]|jgi:FkbM family methyltransferase|uniref:FkbM family methyltransferase n=1 Tax=Mojavia pulchra JT2-VF2 TaxID=287848 RepID=A0A951PYA1_9NOST|nr:FkbM family methyltransferase [Mojavia pulchra JT2-VF2]